jgi:hypothetical protein
MARNRVFRSVLIVSGVLLIAACATQPRESLLERKFQQTAKHYQKFQHEGRTVYCRKDLPPGEQCITEAALRRQVEHHERYRNAVSYTRSPPG